ncbi:MAG: hypothetical protein RMK20_12675 [Verrucomicrobiales bacterium]|nr:hypothetical protein [Verrucomicrobiales bacterium]
MSPYNGEWGALDHEMQQFATVRHTKGGPVGFFDGTTRLYKANIPSQQIPKPARHRPNSPSGIFSNVGPTVLAPVPHSSRTIRSSFRLGTVLHAA